jgi:glycerophosphoryl diester phosphodiesterase
MIKIISISLIFILVLFLVYKKNFDTSPEIHFEKPILIAHASGGINGLTYLNSLEALNHNYALGHRFFEVDWSQSLVQTMHFSARL